MTHAINQDMGVYHTPPCLTYLVLLSLYFNLSYQLFISVFHAIRISTIITMVDCHQVTRVKRDSANLKLALTLSSSNKKFC